jgi:hypothetical protein
MCFRLLGVNSCLCVLGAECLGKIRQVSVVHPRSLWRHMIYADDGSPLSGETLVGCHLAIYNAEIAFKACLQIMFNSVQLAFLVPPLSFALVRHPCRFKRSLDEARELGVRRLLDMLFNVKR